jgi:hypothetical protein
MNFNKSLFLALGLISCNLFAAPKPAGAGGSRPSMYMGSAMDATFLGTNSPGWTAIFVATEKTLVQIYLGVSQTNPLFLMGAGANLKYSVSGDAANGFHLGFGIGSGAITSSGSRTMYINFSPVMGVHFHITERVMLNFDTGVTFQMLTEGTALNFILGGNSPLLGGSVTFAL